MNLNSCQGNWIFYDDYYPICALISTFQGEYASYYTNQETNGKNILLFLFDAHSLCMSLCIEMPLQLLHDVYVTYSTRHLQAVGRTFQPADVNRNQIFVTIFRIKNFSGSSRLWLSVSDRKTDVQQINMSLSLCMNTFLIFLT